MKTEAEIRDILEILRRTEAATEAPNIRTWVLAFEWVLEESD